LIIAEEETNRTDNWQITEGRTAVLNGALVVAERKTSRRQLTESTIGVSVRASLAISETWKLAN
jgi:hypothetical protein